jgi:hypothetical protein
VVLGVMGAAAFPLQNEAPTGASITERGGAPYLGSYLAGLFEGDGHFYASCYLLLQKVGR